MVFAAPPSDARDASNGDAAAVLLPLSPMDAAMGPFGFTILYVFPPPLRPSSSSSSSANTGSSAQPFDLERLHASFKALVETEYRVLLGALHVHPTTGVVSVRQTPEDAKPGAARAIPFEKRAMTHDDDRVTTDDAMVSRSMAFTPTREPSQLVTIKATLLSDGGLALGINMTHTLLDGEGMFTFVKVWGEFYRGVAPSERTVVCHDRSVLAARGVGATLPHPEFKVRPARAPVAETKTETEATTAVTAAAATPATPPTTAQHIFHISPAQLEQLRAVATGASASGNGDTCDYVSTTDALTALLLLLITQARGHGQDVRFTTGVNGRKRFSPPLPANYAGNVIFNALSTYSAAELASVSASAVQTIARRVRQSIVRRDDAFLRDAIEFVASQANAADVLVGTDFFFGPDVMLTSWANMGMYDADFGAETTPWFVGPPQFPLCDGMVVVMEGMRGASGRDVVVLLETHALERLKTLWADVPFWT